MKSPTDTNRRNFLALIPLFLGIGLLVFGVGVFSEPGLRSFTSGPPGGETGGQYEVMRVSWLAVLAGAVLIGGAVHRLLNRAHPLALMIGPGVTALIAIAAAIWNTKQGDSSQLFNEWSDGRPLRDDQGVAVLSSAPTATEASPAAAFWLEASRHEASSIATFETLAQHFAEVGAPDQLVAGARRAAAEEAKHEHVCREIARRLGAIVADEPSVRPSVPPSLTPSIAELAAAAFTHGVIGEGFAVERLDAGSKCCCPTVAPLLRGLQRDEQGHIELARATIRWAIATGEDDVRHALAMACAELPGAVRIPPHVSAVDSVDRARAGLCSDAQAQRAWTRVVTREQTWLRTFESDRANREDGYR